MSLNRTCIRLAVGMLVLLISTTAIAQDLLDAQLFAPADLSTYGGGPRPKEGYFFIYDGLNWSISSPDMTTVGFPGLTRTVFYGAEPADAVIQSNTLDTGFLKTTPKGGERFEFGRVTDRHGWFVSTYQLRRQTQHFTSSDVPMVFADPEFGPQGQKFLEGIVDSQPDPDDPADPDDPDSVGGTIDIIRDLPLTFDEVSIENKVETWNVELMYLYRFRQRRHGGVFEFFAGVRYMEFDDFFGVDARGESDVAAANGDDDGTEPEPEPLPARLTPDQVGSILADSVWNTAAENHIIGPQLGLRWFRQNGRWMFSTEGRYLSGFNYQNLRQKGTLGDKLTPPGEIGEPLLMAPTSFNHTMNLEEYSSVVELRADLRYQVTRAVSLRAGWTGIWMDGIARASNLINYEVPDMGLRPEFNRQDAFMHGWNLGVVVNR